MAINNCQLKGIKVDEKRNYIIEKYVSGIKIHILAEEFSIAVDTLCRKLKKWGIKIRKGDFKKKARERGHFRRKFSPELKVKMNENTRINNNHIVYCKFVNTSRDQRLIRNVLCRSIIG